MPVFATCLCSGYTFSVRFPLVPREHRPLLLCMFSASHTVSGRVSATTQPVHSFTFLLPETLCSSRVRRCVTYGRDPSSQLGVLDTVLGLGAMPTKVTPARRDHHPEECPDSGGACFQPVPPLSPLRPCSWFRSLWPQTRASCCPRRSWCLGFMVTGLQPGTRTPSGALAGPASPTSAPLARWCGPHSS